MGENLDEEHQFPNFRESACAGYDERMSKIEYRASRLIY